MPSNHHMVNETDQSEFRKLPQIDSFESEHLKKGHGSNRNLKVKEDLNDP
jgi:hypothetical protein